MLVKVAPCLYVDTDLTLYKQHIIDINNACYYSRVVTAAWCVFYLHSMNDIFINPLTIYIIGRYRSCVNMYDYKSRIKLVSWCYNFFRHVSILNINRLRCEKLKTCWMSTVINELLIQTKPGPFANTVDPVAHNGEPTFVSYFILRWAVDIKGMISQSSVVYCSNLFHFTIFHTRLSLVLYPV